MQKATLAVCLLPYALPAAAPAGAPFTLQQILFTEDFRDGLGKWTSELEKPGKVETRGGILMVDVPAGCTLWFRPELSGANTAS